MNSMKKVEKRNQGKVNCGECGSINTAVSSLSLSLFALGSLCLLSCTVLIWIPFIGWAILPGALGIAAILYLASFVAMFFTKYTITCKDCNSQFTVDKKEYRELIKTRRG